MTNLKKPCDSCPFLKDSPKAIRLTPGRVREIARYFLDSQGAAFPCHNTVDYSHEADADQRRAMRERESLCAGGMIFADAQDKANQIVRIFERLGLIDWDTLRQSRPLVFASTSEMLRKALPCRFTTPSKKTSPARNRSSRPVNRRRPISKA